MRIAIVDLSGDSRVTKDGLNQIAASLTKQAAVDVAGWWETQPIEVGTFDALADVPADWCVFRLVKTLSDANALAYHTTDANGRPSLYCGTDVIFNNGGTLLSGSLSISAAMSHEVIETICDPYTDSWSDMPDGVREIAFEACDPVEGDAYDIDGVSLSSFVGPRYFSEGPGPYDFFEKLSEPFTMSPGGYQVLRTGGPSGNVSQVFGELMPQWKRDLKAAHSRRVRRHREKHGV